MKLAEVNPFIRYASELKFHGHSGFMGVHDCRIIYIEDGKGVLETKEISYELKPGYLLYCPAGSIYKLVASSDLTLLILNFDLTWQSSHIKYAIAPVPIDNFHAKRIFAENTVDDACALNELFILKQGSEFFASIREIVHEFSEHKIYYREKVGSQLKELLIQLCRKKENGSDNSLDKVIEYIRIHYKEEITNSQLGELAGFHEYYLNRLFLKHTGLSLHKYLIKFRLKEARRLLLNTDLSISEIGEEIGIHNCAYFSDCFSKEYGMSPTKYRKLFQNTV